MVGHLGAVFAEGPLLQALWGFLVVNSVKGVTLFVMAWAVLKICRGPSSELRHLVWLLVIVSSVVFPLVWMAAPGLRLGLPVATGRGAAPLAAVVPLISRGQFLEIMTVPGMDSVVADHRVMRLRRVLPWLSGGLWAAGALVFLQRLAVGRVAASMVLRRARPASMDPGYLEELCRELGIRGRVTIALSRECGIPFTFGLLRPVVLLPTGAAQWPALRLRSVLLHELTHVRRRECLYNSIAASICALLWFLPVLWLAYSSMRREAEKCSDRSVLRHGIPRNAYASDLLELVHGAPSLVLAAGTAIPLGRTRFLKERITGVLASSADGLNRPLKIVAAALTAVFCCALALLALGGASLPGDKPLVGSWANPDNPTMQRQTWTADGRVFAYLGRGSGTPSVVGRYTIVSKWTDQEGSIWYHLTASMSPPPYREELAKCTNYIVIRIDPEAGMLEYNQSPYRYAEKLTVGWYHVLYREPQGKR